MSCKKSPFQASLSTVSSGKSSRKTFALGLGAWTNLRRLHPTFRLIERLTLQNLRHLDIVIPLRSHYYPNYSMAPSCKCDHGGPDSSYDCAFHALQSWLKVTHTIEQVDLRLVIPEQPYQCKCSSEVVACLEGLVLRPTRILVPTAAFAAELVPLWNRI